MPKVSVIIPVYNAEITLHRCVDSVLAQTFTNFELILINDGSIDDSKKICDDYAKKDSRVVVIHKENGGVSSARNRGINIARGKWITFIDSDDCIHAELLENLYKGDEDLKICGYFDQLRSDSPNDRVYNSVKECANYLDLECKHNYINAPWAKLFKASIIKQNNLLFNESLSLGEDTVFVLYYFNYCNSVRTINKALYCYNRPNSLATKYNFNSSKMNAYLTGIHNAVYLLEKSNGKNLKSIHSWINYDCFNRYNEFLTTCDKQTFCKEMAYYRKHCYKYHPKMSNKELIYLWGQMLFPRYFYKLKK